MSPTLVDIAYGAHIGLSDLRKFDINNARSVTLAIGGCRKGLIVRLVAGGFIGVMVTIGFKDSQEILRIDRFGTFEQNEALGSLILCAGTRAVGPRGALSPVNR